MYSRYGKTLYFNHKVFIIVVILFVLNCSPVHYRYSEVLCDDSTACEEYYSNGPMGNVELLISEPIDILLILDNTDKAKGLNPSIRADLFTFLDCIDVPSLDWRLGIILSGDLKGRDFEGRSPKGGLINLEKGGDILSDQYLSPETEDYEKVLYDSVSLDSMSSKSGCDLPPYCSNSKHPNPLTVLKLFMQDSTKGSHRFLREYTPLTTIIVSATHEGDKEENVADVLTTIQRKSDYYKNGNHFMNMTVTTDGTADDCVTTWRDHVDNGAKTLSALADLAILATQFNPIALMARFTIEIFSRAFYKKSAKEKQRTEPPHKRVKIVDFTHQTGGPTPFDICRSGYGKALAAKIMDNLGMYTHMAKECRTDSGISPLKDQRRQKTKARPMKQQSQHIRDDKK